MLEPLDHRISSNPAAGRRTVDPLTLRDTIALRGIEKEALRAVSKGGGMGTRGGATATLQIVSPPLVLVSLDTRSDARVVRNAAAATSESASPTAMSVMDREGGGELGNVTLGPR